MRYSSYKAKYANTLKKINFFNKFKFVFIGAAALAVVTTGTLLAIKGNVGATSTSKTTYYVGEKIEVDSSALMNDYYIEYALKNSEDWSTKAPKRPGEYKARGVSKGAFGKAKYGKETYFSIIPLDLNLPISSTSTIYGEAPLLELSEANKRNLTITNATFSYGKKFEEENPFGENATFKEDVSLIASDVKITDIEGEDVTECYNIISETKSIEISKRDLSVYVHGATKVYDGTELSNSEDYEVSAQTPLAFDDELAVVSSPSISDIGKIANAMTFRVVRGEKDKTAFYKTINVVSEDLEIRKRSLIFSTNSIDREYNGYALSDETENEENKLTYEVTGDGLLSGHYIEHVVFTQKGKFITNSRVQNAIDLNEIYIVDKDGNSVKNYYQFGTSNFGYINIRKRTIEVSYETLSKTYDGVALNAADPVISGSFASTDTPVFTTESSRLDPGTQQINELFEIYSNNPDLSDNNVTNQFYNVHVSYGLLTVNKIDIYVSTKPITRTKYNGYALSSSLGTASENLLDYTVNDNDLVSGHHFKFYGYALENKRIVNDQDNSIYFDIVDDDNNSVLYMLNSPYVIHTDFRRVNIEPLNVTYTFAKVSEYYTGGTFNVPYTRTGDDIPLTDTPIVEYEQIGPTCKTYNFNPTVRINGKDGDCVSDNAGECCYNITIITNTVEVKKIPLTIWTNDINDKTYDGKPYSYIDPVDSSHTLDYSVTGLLPEHELVFHNFDNEGIYVGNIKNTISFDIVDKSSGFTVTGYEDIYNIIDHCGYINIAQRDANLQFSYAQKTYDGTVLAPNYTISGLLEGDTLVTPASSSGSSIDYYQGYYQPQVYNSEREVYVTDCYNFNSSYYYYGMEITRINLNVRSGDITKVYDGKLLQTGDSANDLRHTITNGSLLPNHELVVSYSYLGQRNVTPIDGYENYFYVSQVKNMVTGEDVTDMYNINCDYGTIKITKRPLVINISNKLETFNGGAKNTTVEHGPLGEGDLFTYDKDFIDVGTYYNNYSFFDVKYMGNSVINNYSISSDIAGTLTIEPLEVTYYAEPIGGGDTYSKEYDGKSISTSVFVPHFSVEEPYGYQFVISYQNVDTLLVTGGKKSLDYTMRILWTNPETLQVEDKTNSPNFSIQKMPNKDIYYEITKRYLNIDANCDVEYNGQFQNAYTQENYTYSNLGEGDSVTTFTSTFNGSINITNGQIPTTVGSFAVYHYGSQDVTNCYYWDNEVGTTQINKRNLYIDFDYYTPFEKTYDGTQVQGYQILTNTYVDGLASGQYLSFDLYGSDSDYINWTNDTYAECTIRNQDIKITDGYGNNVKDNYNIIVSGTPRYKILKRNLYLTFNCNRDLNITYDGYSHNVEEYSQWDYDYGYNYGLCSQDKIVSNTNSIMNATESIDFNLQVSSFATYFNIVSKYGNPVGRLLNYNISINEYSTGWYHLTMIKRDLHLYANGYDKVYDGESFMVHENWYCPDLPQGFIVSGQLNLYDQTGEHRIASDSCTDVGQYKEMFDEDSILVRRSSSYDYVTENFHIITEPAFVNIYQRIIYYRIVDSDITYGSLSNVNHVTYLDNPSQATADKYFKIVNYSYGEYGPGVADNVDIFLSYYYLYGELESPDGQSYVDFDGAKYVLYMADGRGYYFSSDVIAENKNDPTDTYSRVNQNVDDNVVFVTDSTSTQPDYLNITTHRRDILIENVVNGSVVFYGNQTNNQEKLVQTGKYAADTLYIGSQVWSPERQEYTILNINGYYESGKYMLTPEDSNYFNHVLNDTAVSNRTIRITRTITHPDNSKEEVDVTNCYNFTFKFSDYISFEVI